MLPSDNATPVMLVEALLLTSAAPLTISELTERLPPRTDVRRALVELHDAYATRGICLVEIDGGWAVRTRPEHSDLCRKILPRSARLTNAALETLSVIAYFQPVTRSEIERVRGVSLAKGTMDILVWAGLVRPGPRRQSTGNPMTFLTTEKFLSQFDLRSLDELPDREEMREAGLLAEISHSLIPTSDAEGALPTT